MGLMDQTGPSRKTRGSSVIAGIWPGAQSGTLSGSDKANLQIWRETAGHTLGNWIALEVERRRLFNWIPVCMGLGVLAYFAADKEPAVWAPVLASVVFSVLAYVFRQKTTIFIILVAICAVFIGFAASVIRTLSVAAPVLDRMRIGQLTGFVETVEKRGGGSRIVVILTGFSDLAPEIRPNRVRVSLMNGSVNPGDHITALARLLPPPEPARPGGYDFARDAFYRGIGAVGSLPGKVALSAPPVAPPAGLALAVAIDKARNALTERISRTIGGQAGAVAAALVTGKRGLISEETNETLRAAGLYHVVSISGLHMVLAAGTIFWLVRALLALSATVALTWPVKKLAALAAMLGATAYCIFSGSDVATERSLIMTLVMLGAILVDRPALSMRNLAIAAILVLLREPDTMLGPSFQMSFGAVGALIAFNERWQERRKIEPPVTSLAGRVIHGLYLAAIGTFVTTVLATGATAPFSIYHFQTLNPYGLIGNSLALPFISLVVMPAAVIGVLAYPFGLDGLAWSAMGWATVPFLAVARWVAGIERSTVVVPAFGAGAVLLLAFALLWVTLWTTRLRYLAVIPFVLGALVAANPRRADIFIDRDGAGALVRARNGHLVIVGKPSGFTTAQWLAADGDNRKPADQTLREAATCDAQGCVVTLAGGRTLSFISTSRAAIAEDCERADIVITPMTWRSHCRAQLVDRQMLDRHGTMTMTASIAGWGLKGQRGDVVDRPWLRKPRQPPTGQASAPQGQGNGSPQTPMVEADPADPDQ